MIAIIKKLFNRKECIDRKGEWKRNLRAQIKRTMKKYPEAFKRLSHE